MQTLIQYCTQGSHYDGAFDSKVGWSAAGMGYLIKTENGRLIAIDGGNHDDAEGFLHLLEANADGQIPEIDLWIITHPHGDHYFALLDMCKREELRSRFRVHQILYHFPAEFRTKNGDAFCNAHNRNMEFILEVTGATCYTPRVDEKITVDGMELHFLYTPTDCSILNNPNQLSLIFSIQGKNKKLLVTGDAFERNLLIALWRYGAALKSDILQMPHHGLCDTGNIDFYKKVDANTLLIPISVAGDRTMHSDMYGEAPKANRFAEDRAEVIYRAFEGTVELEM